MDEDIVGINGLSAEIISRTTSGELDANRVARALRGILKDAHSTPSGPTAPEDRFTSVEDQVSNLRDWTRMLDLAWTDEQLDRVAAETPAYADDEPLIPITLCWTLGDLRTSIDTKLEILRLVYGDDKVSITRDFKTDAKHTKVVGGAPEFLPNRLWWQLIDLGANRFKAPNQVPVATAAGCEIFDVICQHPIYVGQQDGSETPYLDLPGLSVKVRGISGPDTPDLAGGSEGQVAVRVRWEGSVYPDHAEPVRES